MLLSERGLATSPHPVLRTAFECLFYACSVWRYPGLAAKMEATGNAERVKQAKQVIAAGAATRVEPRRLAELEAVAAEVHTRVDGLSAHEAATKGDLIWEYEVVYRGLGLGGAHATLRSLDSYVTTKPDGSLDLDFEPKSEKLDWLLGLVVTCLIRGIERHREASAKLGPEGLAVPP